MGDGLQQLERLLAENDHPKWNLLGEGEGAVMALCLALLHPAKIACLDLPALVIPENLSRMPLSIPCAAPLQITTDDTKVHTSFPAIFPAAHIR